MQAEKPFNIIDLIRSSKKVLDVRFANDDDIVYLTSSDGIGELFVLGNNKIPEKISRELNIRGTVGYGGGDFDVNTEYYAACDKSGSIFSIESKEGHRINQVATHFQKTSSPKISPDGKRMLFIYDQNDIGGIGVALIQQAGSDRQLVTGSDFYMHPTWHPDDKMIAWAEWDHPFMPWDASRIMIGRFNGKESDLSEEMIIDGGPYESANQPLFSPDGKWLSYIKRNDNWDDLILYDLVSHEKKVVVAGDGFHLRMPDWIQGQRSYQWSCDSASIVFIKYHRGTSSLAKVDLSTSRIIQIDSSPYVWVSQLASNRTSETYACIASSESNSDQILSIVNEKVTPIIIDQKESNRPASKAQEITFLTEDGGAAYAWFYPPKTKPMDGSIPPCILNIHSGPTSVDHLGFSSETEIFTSQGYSIVYLNYRGSVTFGYDYQYALRRKWGEAEVMDAAHLVTTLILQGLVDPQKIAVMGSSAGGLSVLNIMIQNPGTYKAGICSYAVSDLVDDAQHTHKFEKYYHRFLTGEYPAELDRFISRSPISHVDEIKDPLALFHGAEDKVVSPEQSKKIYASLSNRGIPCSLKIYEEEGHGFRNLENIADYYNTVFNFLAVHLK